MRFISLCCSGMGSFCNGFQTWWLLYILVLGRQSFVQLFPCHSLFLLIVCNAPSLIFVSI